MQVRIPEIGGPLLCGQIFTNQGICGSPRAADSYQDFPQELQQGTAELLTTAPVHNTVSVEVTGYLDMIAGTAEVVTVQDAIVVVEASGLLDLDGGSADLFWQKNVTVPEPLIDPLLCGETVLCGQHICGEALSGDYYYDFTLDLFADPVVLTLDNLLRLDESAALELLGGPVRVNPVLMPDVCTDLDLVVSLCLDLDLVASTVEEIDLDQLVCLEA